MSSTDSRLAPSTRLGPYTLRRRVGQGASAQVWAAEDADGHLVAVKVRRRGMPAMDRRFLREFESMRALRLPGVVRVFEAAIEENFLWFSMELVDGEPFSDVIAAVPEPLKRVGLALDLSRQLFEVLSALHQAGFVHRDVKPSNVLVDRDGHVNVLDFGIVRFFTDRDQTNTTGTGEVLGTVPYMAPEQLAGLPSDQAVDLFASGLMVWEALAGKRPRPALPVGWIPRTCMERPAPLATLFKEVPRGFSRLVEDLLAVDPRDRPSATDAVRRARRLARGEDTHDCPEPDFVDPEGWWHPIEGCIGQSGHSPIQVLEGPAGSGRGRIAEHLHRLAILQGVWPIHLHCRVDAVGGPLVELVQVLLAASADESWSRAVTGKDAGLLRRMWPNLHLPGDDDGGTFPSPIELAGAVSRCLARAAEQRPLLIVVHDLEQVDPLTARAVPLFAEFAGPSLGLLLTHDSRWMTRESNRVVDELRSRHDAGVRPVPRLTPDAAQRIAASLCPDAPPTDVRADTPQQAVEAGLLALATWRGDGWAPPPESLWPLAVRDAPVPEEVLARLAGAAATTSPWVAVDDDGLRFAGTFATRAARARLTDRRGAAEELADAWARTRGRDASWPALAALYLLAEDPSRAWRPAALSAIAAEEKGRYADARRWLLLLDTLPDAQESSAQDLVFELAVVRARVALNTEVGAPRTELLEACERLARTERHQTVVRLLRAEYDLRGGHARPALVASLRAASSLAADDPQGAVRALLVATQCRFVIDQLDEVHHQLERARLSLANDPSPLLTVQLDNQRAEYLLRRHELQECRALCQKIIRRAAEAGYLRGASFAAARLGKVLRQLGRRREAEHQTRTAREGFASTGDILLDVETGLALATLLVERGDTPGARHLLDDVVHRIRGLRLDHLLPAAMRVALEIATVRGDPADAAVALTALAEAGDRDPEIPAVLVRWFRSRGDVQRALAVEGPPAAEGFSHAMWRVERARVAMMAARRTEAITEAAEAYRIASDAGYAEIQLYARLLLGVLEPDRGANWPQVLENALGSLHVELYLGALEMDARRLADAGAVTEANGKWRTLLARSRELGYRPGVEEAAGWLGDDAPR